MKVAIANNRNLVANKFGHCEGFKIFDFENGMVGNFEDIENPGHRPGFLPKFLRDLGVKVVIANSMGSPAQALFKNYEIEVYTGIEGEIFEAINKFSKGQLVSKEVVCNHHEE